MNVAAAVDKSLLQCNAFEGSYPSLPRSLPLLPLPSSFDSCHSSHATLAPSPFQSLFPSSPSHPPFSPLHDFTLHTCTSPPPPHSSEREGHRTEQNVEQARPTDPNEEELQLKLALQLSKQQAENDKLRCGHFSSYLYISPCGTLLSAFISIHPFPSPLQTLPLSF